METIKDQMQEVLAVERDKNNKVFATVVRGTLTPTDVKKAKVEYIQARYKDGISIAKAAKEARIGEGTFFRWGGTTGKRPDKRKRVEVAGVAVPKKKTWTAYSELDRAKLVQKARTGLASGVYLNWTHAAALLKVGQSTLCRWNHWMDRKRAPHGNGGIRVKAAGTAPSEKPAPRQGAWLKIILDGIQRRAEALSPMGREELENKLMRIYFESRA